MAGGRRLSAKGRRSAFLFPETLSSRIPGLPLPIVRMRDERLEARSSGVRCQEGRVTC
jgi:hypothetical protein